MSDRYTIIGTKGCGSAIAEAFLTLAKIPYEYQEVNYDLASPERDALLRLNPLGQIPTMILPDGSVLTETLAIAAVVNSRVSELGLIPHSSKDLELFWRWALFIVAAIYPTFTYGDSPSKWVSLVEGAAQLRESTDAHRLRLWKQLEIQARAPYFLGTTFSAIDIYIAVMAHWRPGVKWFQQNTPKLHAIAQELTMDPRLTNLWESHWAEP